jgi:hypothetical protein
MKWLREACASMLVHAGVWILDLATAIDEPREASKREAPEPEPDRDDAPPQAPITAEAAELLAPPPNARARQAKKSGGEPLRGSLRARREKATAL